MSNITSLVGQKFHRLLVLEFAGHVNNRPAWLCLCDCGKTKVVQGKYLKNGDTKSCGCQKLEVQKQLAKYMRSCRPQFSPKISVARSIWRQNSTYQEDLLFDDFYFFSQQKCFYCGINGSNFASIENSKNKFIASLSDSFFTYNGIDRLDSNKSYELDNCVSSCWICNRENEKEPLNNLCGK